ncbi:MAG: dihydrolipoyl dehydrogenase [Phycisphaerae bacterium]|nr:dihydrolipoyl dehydrogenase [Phycisphaerae bacterium]
MAYPITVPRLGWEMEEAVFVEWLKKEGEPVKEGEPLFVLEGDKAVQEVEAIDSGILRIPPDAPNPGDTVVVGAILGYLVEPGEEAPLETSGAAVAPNTRPTSAGSPAPASPTIAPSVATEPLRAISATTRRGPTISPRAARLAAELGVEWSRLHGTGKTGRIRERDVRAAAATATKVAPAAGPAGLAPDLAFSGRAIPVGPVRRRIADRMAASAHTTAPVTLTTTADVTRLVALRAQLKGEQRADDEPVPSYTDMIVKLTAATLGDHPMLNARWADDKIVLPDGVHVGVAVDTDAGLLVPVVRDTPGLSLRQLAVRSRDLIDRARRRRLAPDEMQGGTFTVSNLGSFGVEAFTPIINLPECAILGLGRIRREPVLVDDRVEPRDTMALSLTFDHRVVDGGPAARFLDAVRSAIEQPDLLEEDESDAAAAPASQSHAIAASTEPREAVIIGAGPGGYVAALRIAAMGGKATLIERSCVGGVCLNTGCIPTKAMLHVAKLYSDLKTAASVGIEAGDVRLDFAKVVAHKDKVVAGLTKGLGALLKGRNVNVVAGRGRLIEPHTVGVDSPDGVLRIPAPNVILATGTIPAPLPGLDIDGERILNTDQALAMQALPESALIIGAGPNGVEFATMLAEFGSSVTLVEAMDRVLPTVDADAAKEVAKSLKKRRVTVHCGTKVDGVNRRDDGLAIRLDNGQTVEAAIVIVAIGRRTRIDDLGLDEAGVRHDGRFIQIDERCATTAPGVYAIGDITGKGPYAHVAYRQGTVAASNIMGVAMTEDYRVVPTVVFSHPELAQVGLGEDAARAAGVEIETGRFRYQASGAAQAFGQPEGFCKLVAEAGSRRVLGATMVGFRAAEVIHEVAVAIRAGMTVGEIAETIHAHPSLAEPVVEAADALLGMPLHSL